MYKRFPSINLMFKLVFVRFWCQEHTPRWGMSFHSPLSLFKPSNPIVLLPNRPKLVSNLLAYAFLVKSSIHFIFGVVARATGLHHKPLSSVSIQTPRWSIPYPVRGVCSGGPWYCWVHARLSHFRSQVNLVRFRLRGLNVSSVLVSFKFNLVSVVFICSCLA